MRVAKIGGLVALLALAGCGTAEKLLVRDLTAARDNVVAAQGAHPTMASDLAPLAGCLDAVLDRLAPKEEGPAYRVDGLVSAAVLPYIALVVQGGASSIDPACYAVFGRLMLEGGKRAAGL